MLEKVLESPLDSKEIKPVNSKGNQPWLFIGRTDAEAEAPILWPPDAKNQLVGKDPVSGKDWRQEEKGMTKDEMVGWHHRLNGREFEQTPEGGEGQQSLVYCSPWSDKESDMTEWVDSNNKLFHSITTNPGPAPCPKYMFNKYRLNKWMRFLISWLSVTKNQFIVNQRKNFLHLKTL